MSALGGHAVDVGVAPVDTPLAEVDGVALEPTVARVQRFGGHPGRYRAAVGRGLTAGGRGQLRALAVVAGWRSGVLGLRAESLDVLSTPEALDPTVAAAVLGLDPDDLGDVVDAQRADPLAWPGAPDLVARVGGFAGLGGWWLAPPLAALPVGPGRLAVITADDLLWWVEVDVFGARLEPDHDATADRTTTDPDAGLRGLVSADSYLLEIRRTR